ncbi:MAG: S8 family serine peptidase [Acidimicrobiales bacterium]
MPQFHHRPSGRPVRLRRRGRSSLLALLALIGGLAVPAHPRAAGEDVGVLRPSSGVEMLAGELAGKPMTLAEARKAIQAVLPDPTLDGKGIDVALIDTGVAPVKGLDGDNVIHGPDLSFEASVKEAAYLDTYGHGTHMAGIIAGRRAGSEGIAPGARIVSIKTAGHDGITTVPQVVAAIDWVVDHRDADGMNIRIINLSLGQTGVAYHVGDLLSAAVERAWTAGIFVVVAAGNEGETQRHLDSPAIDPYIFAVGATDPTTGGVAPWSAYGDGRRDPDAVTVGRSLVSYRVPGSTVDNAAPGARVGTDSFLGSGTSQAAAVTSGLAARILQGNPWMSPNQLKATLLGNADDLPTPAYRDGHGAINGYRAVANMDQSGGRQRYPRAAGRGSGIRAPYGSTWSGGTWSGATWSGATWSGATWSGGTWSGATWSGATWSGATWTGGTWSGATWSGATWSGATWTGATWSGATWTGGKWS